METITDELMQKIIDAEISIEEVFGLKKVEEEITYLDVIVPSRYSFILEGFKFVYSFRHKYFTAIEDKESKCIVFKTPKNNNYTYKVFRHKEKLYALPIPGKRVTETACRQMNIADLTGNRMKKLEEVYTSHNLKFNFKTELE